MVLCPERTDVADSHLVGFPWDGPILGLARWRQPICRRAPGELSWDNHESWPRSEMTSLTPPSRSGYGPNGGPPETPGVVETRSARGRVTATTQRASRREDLKE